MNNLSSLITLTWPLDKVVLTQLFGQNPDYYFPKYGYPGHNGIDLAGSIGDLIHASADGLVVDLGYDPTGWGNYIVLAHKLPGNLVHTYKTIYAHMDQPTPLHKNITVLFGDMIGLMGWTGNVFPEGPAGTHLHFGLRDLSLLSSPYKGWIDPIPHFKAQPTPWPPASPSASYVTVNSIVGLAAGIDCLNMRSAPSTNNSIIYSLMYAEHPPVKVEELYNSGQDIWIRTDIYWMAFKYNDVLYMQVIDESKSAK